MKNTSFSPLSSYSIDTNFNYPFYYPYFNSPIPYIPNNIDSTHDSEERLVPFVGGAILGGLAGNALSRPNYAYGYGPYTYNYMTPYYPYYPNGTYYSYGGGYLPSTYNNYYYRNQTPRNLR